MHRQSREQTQSLCGASVSPVKLKKGFCLASEIEKKDDIDRIPRESYPGLPVTPEVLAYPARVWANSTRDTVFARLHPRFFESVCSLSSSESTFGPFLVIFW
jgi:hypothetical protein